MVTVVCTGGEAPPRSLSLAWLERAQSVVAVDSGIALIRDLGKKADLWVGDGDSLVGTPEEWSPWYKEVLSLDRDKDDTDTEAAVREILARGPSDLWLLGGGGGRMDHWLANLRLVAGQPAFKRWGTAHEEGWLLGPGDRLAVPAGTVSVYPLGSAPWLIRSNGLKWPIDHLDFQWWHSQSNEAGHSGAEFSVDRGRFLVLKTWALGVAT